MALSCHRSRCRARRSFSPSGRSRDDNPGKPVARALAETKLDDIDAQMASLQRARQIILWGMKCECLSIDDCTCGIHHTLLA
jgi:hypothetical protein